MGRGAAVLEQGRNRLGRGGPRDLRDRLDRGERDLDLVARLDAIRLEKMTVVDGRLNVSGADGEYEKAFRELAGIEVDGDVEAAAARVRESSVRDTLLAALDDWALCAAEGRRTNWLLPVARAADPDPWRRRARDPAAWGDRDGLLRLLAEKDAEAQSPLLLVALASRLLAMQADPEPPLRAAHRRHPGDFWVNFLLGVVLGRKRPADALGYYLAALALRPDTFVLRSNLGTVLDDLGRREEAVAEFHKALELAPQLAMTHSNLGRALENLGRRDEALAAYHKALELDPHNAVARYNLATALGRAGRREEAVAEFRKAVEINPRYAEAYYNLAITLREMGRRDEAADACRKAVAINPRYSFAHYTLGVVLMETGRRQEAIAAYLKAIESDPKFASPYSNLGVILRDLGRAEEALILTSKAVELDPKSAAAHANLGVNLATLNRTEEAVVAYRRALELDPKYAAAHHNLGMALRALGRREEAVAAFQKAVTLSPQFAEAHWALGTALLHLGRFAEARQSTSRSLSLLPAAHSLRAAVAQQLQLCEQMIALDEKLPAYLRGEARPAGADEQLRLAQLCRYKRHYAGAARFFADAFASRPALAEDVRTSHRYDAACFASLAAGGQGEDAARLDDRERARLRRQALDWLRAELTVRGKQIDTGTPQDRVAAQRTLRHWRQDADLAPVRAAALAKLPEAERVDWLTFWNDVAALLNK